MSTFSTHLNSENCAFCVYATLFQIVCTLLAERGINYFIRNEDEMGLFQLILNICEDARTVSLKTNIFKSLTRVYGKVLEKYLLFHVTKICDIPFSYHSLNARGKQQT